MVCEGGIEEARWIANDDKVPRQNRAHTKNKHPPESLALISPCVPTCLTVPCYVQPSSAPYNSAITSSFNINSPPPVRSNTKSSTSRATIYTHSSHSLSRSHVCSKPRTFSLPSHSPSSPVSHPRMPSSKSSPATQKIHSGSKGVQRLSATSPPVSAPPVSLPHGTPIFSSLSSSPIPTLSYFAFPPTGASRSLSSTGRSYRSNSGVICRICHDGEGVGELVSPCLCSGSVATVHRLCLEKWLTQANANKCELCGYVFTLVRTPRPFTKFLLKCDNPEIRRALKVDVTCLLILTPLAAFSIYLCITGAIHFAQGGHHPSVAIFADRVLAIVKGRQNLKQGGVDPKNKTGYLGDHKGERGPEYLAWEAMGLVLLAILLVAIYLAWTLMAAGYHVRVWRHWRILHQNVTLIHPSGPASQNLVSRSRTPVSIFRSPVSLNSTPASVFRSPISPNRTLASPDQALTSANHTPVSSNNIPASSNNTPASSNNIPASSNNIPASSNNTPASSNNIPASSNNIPASSNNSPASSNNSPASSNNTPASSNHASTSPNNALTSPYNASTSPKNVPTSPYNASTSPNNAPTVLHQTTSSDHASALLNHINASSSHIPISPCHISAGPHLTSVSHVRIPASPFQDTSILNTSTSAGLDHSQGSPSGKHNTITTSQTCQNTFTLPPLAHLNSLTPITPDDTPAAPHNTPATPLDDPNTLRSAVESCNTPGTLRNASTTPYNTPATLRDVSAALHDATAKFRFTPVRNRSTSASSVSTSHSTPLRSPTTSIRIPTTPIISSKSHNISAITQTPGTLVTDESPPAKAHSTVFIFQDSDGVDNVTLTICSSPSAARVPQNTSYSNTSTYQHNHTSPVYTPASPVYTLTSPGYTPPSPGYIPISIGYTPTSPNSSTTPSNTPPTTPPATIINQTQYHTPISANHTTTTIYHTPQSTPHSP